MEEKLASQIATGVVTLVVGWLLLQWQDGSLRRRRRREIREELELARLLDEHPETRQRLRRRIEVLLDQYEPAPEKLRERRAIMLVNGAALFLFVVVQWSFFDALYEGRMPWWMGFVIGTSSSALLAGINWAAGRSSDTRAQDKAVAEVTLAGQVAPVTADFRMEASQPSKE